MIKRILRGLLILTGLIVLGFFILKWSFSEDVPTGEKGAKADALAAQVLEALNHNQLSQMDSISWIFRGVNHYTWNMNDRKVTVRWDDTTVNLNTANPDTSLAYENGALLKGSNSKEAIEYALFNFNNDSFWLMAPYKINDPGTEREWISDNELLVRYTSGGSTPGDVYVWKLDDNHLPISFKMWVSIIPLDGLPAQWDGWYKTTAGFMLPKKQSIYGIDIPISDVVVY
jgi:hypothetical protein